MLAMTGIQAGDEMRACLITGTGGTLTPPAGWSMYYDSGAVFTGAQIRKFKKRATGTYGGGATFTWTASAYMNGCTMMGVAIVGANVTQPNASSDNHQATYQDDPITATATTITSSSAHCLGLTWLAASNNATSFDSSASFDNGFTQQDIVGDSTVSSPATRGYVISLASKDLVASGATGDCNITIGHGGVSYRRSTWLASQVAIGP